MPSGKDILFRMKNIEYIDYEPEDLPRQSELGWFGAINQHTFMLQAAYPCLAALMRRIRQDLIVTNNPQHDRDWVPPENVHDPDGHALTANFFGYAPGIKLSGEQTRELNNLDFQHNRYPCVKY